MKNIYDNISFTISKIITNTYSTSFSLGIHSLQKELHDPIFAIYGFVRLADEIVDSFHGYDKKKLFYRFREDVELALGERISLNPALNSFQETVHRYKIDRELIDTFLNSMEMDLEKKDYSRKDFNRYVLGSAEVVGLMCLSVFLDGNRELYEELKPSAMKLGSAFQKINFLRDIKADYHGLGRKYFPGIDLSNFSESDKKVIENEIGDDFRSGLDGTKKLPSSCRFGVYLSYIYYYRLYTRIKKVPFTKIMSERIRISDTGKFFLFIYSYMRYKLNIL